GPPQERRPAEGRDVPRAGRAPRADRSRGPLPRGRALRPPLRPRARRRHLPQGPTEQARGRPPPPPGRRADPPREPQGSPPVKGLALASALLVAAGCAT